MSERKTSHGAVPDELVDACHLVGPVERHQRATAGMEGSQCLWENWKYVDWRGQQEALELVAGEML